MSNFTDSFNGSIDSLKIYEAVKGDVTQYEIQGIFLQREDSVGRQAWEAKLLQKSDGQLHQTCKGNEARHRSVRSRQG